MKSPPIMAVLLAGILLTPPVAAQENLGRKMWSAFQCATYAELSGDEDEQARLFDVGYAAGKRFLEGIESKSIPKAAIQDAPIGVLLLLSGPNIDFMLGRIFESATANAYDAIVKQDDNGVLLEHSKWVTNDALKTAKANKKYLQSNCILIE